MPEPTTTTAAAPTAADLHIIHERLNAGDQRMSRIEDSIAAQEKASQATAHSTAELVEMFQAFQGAFKVLQYVGALAKPLGVIAGFIAAAYGFWASLKGVK